MKSQLNAKFDVEIGEPPDTMSALLSDLVDNPDLETHHWAGELLVRMGPKVLPQLNMLLGSNNKIIRREAIRIIELIGHPSSIPALTASLEDPEHEIRWIATKGLINIRKKKHQAIRIETSGK